MNNKDNDKQAKNLNPEQEQEKKQEKLSAGQNSLDNNNGNNVGNNGEVGEEANTEVEEEAVDTQTLLEKYEAGTNYRPKPVLGGWYYFIFPVSILLSFFQLYTAIFGTLPSNQQRGFHIAIGLGLIYLLYPGRKTGWQGPAWPGWVVTACFLAVDAYLYTQGEIRPGMAAAAAVLLVVFQLAKKFDKNYHRIPVTDIFLAALGFGVGFYQFFFYEDIIARVGMYNDVDYIVAITAVLLVLEAGRRAVGLPITIVGALMLAYAYLGPIMPGFLEHRGFSLERLLSHSFLSLEGILGIPIAISATFIYLYLLFATILQNTGLEKFFSELAVALTGWMTGGTAKACVLTSAFQGTVTGSSVANTVGSGAFTIPMMKRAGYTPEFAAAVEASSSTGGQIMPPIMGAAAFLMIEFTGLPYTTIAAAALIPALLFFAGEFIAVHYESKKMGILGVPRDQLPSLLALLMKKGYLLLPLAAIIFVMMIGQSALKAAWVGVLTALGMNILTIIIAKVFKTDVEDKLTVPLFFKIMAEAARTALPVIAACAAAGIIVGIITLTGLGLKIAGGIVDLAGHRLLLTMAFTMVACILLGMGLPTTVNYVITATMAAPALLSFGGIPVIAAHLFVFYFGIVADITPPVALAAYAGAGIARSNPFLTGVQAVKVAIGAFLVPYMFVLSPVLVLHEVTAFKLIVAIATALLGMVGVSSALVGFFERSSKVWERLLMFAAGLSLIYADLATDLIGLAVLAAIFLYQKATSRKPSVGVPG